MPHGGNFSSYFLSAQRHFSLMTAADSEVETSESLTTRFHWEQHITDSHKAQVLFSY